MKITTEGLGKTYRKGSCALRDVNLTLDSPSLVGLVGPNGAGKTTLMRILVSQLDPSAGEVHVDDKALQAQATSFKRRLGYLPQNFGLYEELTVTQFLDYVACLKEITANRKEVVERCVVETGLEEKAKARIRTLSGGQKQRVGIAQALLNDPELLIVDEPTVGLDPQERIRFRNLLSRNASRQLVILSTHIIDDVESVCDRLVVLHRGAILFDGPPNELVARAVGHVGVMDTALHGDRDWEREFQVTSRVITDHGAKCRIVGHQLPAESEPVEPTLEDAYIYCMMNGEVAQ
jgi:ABC-type multidrug transport system ATPase subunit